MTHVLSAVAWPYANGPRHIGHVAGFGVPSDVFSRYMRMAGHDVLMVSGTDEHGTPILVAADKAGRERRRTSPTRTTRSSCRTSSTSACPTTSSPAPRRATTTAWCRRCSRTVQRNGYMVEQTTQAAISPSTGPHPARPLHRGHLPDLRVRRGARRPVRQLRQPARRHRPDRPALEDQRRDAELRRDPALLPRPAGAGRRARGVARRARGVGHLAAQRHQVLPEHPRGDPAAGDDPRHRLGDPGPARRLARTSRPSGSTSGSTRSSATSPPRSSGPGAQRATPTLARVVERPGGAVLLLHGQGQHRLPLPDLAGRAAGLRRPGDRGGEPGSTATLNLPTEVVSSEFLTMGEQQFSTSRGHVIYVGDFLARYGPDALRYFICAAGPETSDAAFTWADFVTAQQLRAGRRLGQPGQPHRHDDRQELRRDPGRRRASSRSTRPCSTPYAAASTPSVT